jgi:hypothetical protein
MIEKTEGIFFGFGIGALGVPSVGVLFSVCTNGNSLLLFYTLMISRHVRPRRFF